MKQIQTVGCKCNYDLSLDGELGSGVICTDHHKDLLAQAQQEAVEVELNTKQCLEVAKMVYEKYQEAMQPPVFAVYQFPDWLSRQLESLQKGEK